LWRFLPLAVLRTCLAEMVLLPTRFFFASAMSIPLSKEAEDTCGAAWLPQKPCVALDQGREAMRVPGALRASDSGPGDAKSLFTFFARERA
jgi:hypothetical protein